MRSWERRVSAGCPGLRVLLLSLRRSQAVQGRPSGTRGPGAERPQGLCCPNPQIALTPWASRSGSSHLPERSSPLAPAPRPPPRGNATQEGTCSLRSDLSLFVDSRPMTGFTSPRGLMGESRLCPETEEIVSSP